MTADNKNPENKGCVGFEGSRILSQRGLFVVLLLLAAFALVLERHYTSQFLRVFHPKDNVKISRKTAQTVVESARLLDNSAEIIHRTRNPESTSSLDRKEERVLRVREAFDKSPGTLDKGIEPESALSRTGKGEGILDLGEIVDQPNEAESFPSLAKRKGEKHLGTLDGSIFSVADAADQPNETESSPDLEKKEVEKPFETSDASIVSLAETIDQPNKDESAPLEKREVEKPLENLDGSILSDVESMDQPTENELSLSLEKQDVKNPLETVDDSEGSKSSSSLKKQEEDKLAESWDESNDPNSSSFLDKQLEEIDFKQRIDFSVGGCNIWKGEWIPHSSEPAYNNVTCQFIQGHQNCLQNGRPDHRYLYWKWKPYDCDLPLFDAKNFLKVVRGKAWAFAGDSISRNHFQSFLCFLAQVETPENLYRDEKDQSVRWFFPSYEFTLAIFWSPFLVESTEDEAHGFSSSYQKMFLDCVDSTWASSLREYDYIVLSAGNWFLKSSVYFLKDEVIGCHYCPELNLTQVGFYFGFRTALRTAFNFLASNYKGVVFFRTFTPDHFEDGQWFDGGHCTRTTPFRNATIEGVIEEMYKIQLEEFGRILHLNRHIISRFKIADTIHASILRPDGHPGPYRNTDALSQDKNGRVIQDCLHWCLPGAIDTWSAMLLEMLTHV